MSATLLCEEGKCCIVYIYIVNIVYIYFVYCKLHYGVSATLLCEEGKWPPSEWRVLSRLADSVMTIAF